MTNDSPEFRAGFDLAVEMIERLENNENLARACQFSAPIELGQDQRNLVGELIAAANAHGVDGIAGVAAVLSDFISSCLEYGTPAAKYYRNLPAALEGLAAELRRSQERAPKLHLVR